MSTHTDTQTYVVSRVACHNVSSVYCHAMFCIYPFSCVIVKQKTKQTNTDHTLTKTQAAEYITTHHHSIFTKIFLGWVNSRCWAGSGSLLKFTGPRVTFLWAPFSFGSNEQTIYHSCSPPAMMKFFILNNKMHAILSTERLGCSWQF